MVVLAEQFDIAGFPLFIILLITGIQLSSAIVIAISIMGLLADGYSLFTNFIRRKK